MRMYVKNLAIVMQTVCVCVCVCQQLHVFKPVTSKAGNSEQYVICIKFKGTAVLTQDHLKKLSTAYGIMEH